MVIAPILPILFNACFKFGVFPSSLQLAKVIPVFKSGEKSHVTNYRPISILLCFSKILEKAVYDRTTNDTQCQVQLNIALDPIFNVACCT